MGGESDAEKFARREREAKAIEERKRKSMQAQVRSQRELEKEFRSEDIAEGRQRGQELFGELEARTQEERTKDFMAQLERRRQAATQGLTPEEQSALQSQALGGIARGAQTQLRQLRGVQGAAGVTGGLAAQQAGRVLGQAQQQAAQAQQNVFLQNIAARREAEEGLAQQLQQEQQQAQRLRAGQAGVEFGFAGLGAQERSGLRQLVMGQQQAAAAEQQARENEGKK